MAVRSFPFLLLTKLTTTATLNQWLARMYEIDWRHEFDKDPQGYAFLAMLALCALWLLWPLVKVVTLSAQLCLSPINAPSGSVGYMSVTTIPPPSLPAVLGPPCCSVGHSWSSDHDDCCSCERRCITPLTARPAREATKLNGLPGRPWSSPWPVVWFKVGV